MCSSTFFSTTVLPFTIYLMRYRFLHNAKISLTSTQQGCLAAGALQGGIFSSVGVSAGALVAAANAAFAKAADTSLPKLAGLTAVLHHGLQGEEL